MNKYIYRIYVYFVNDKCEKVAVVYNENDISNVIHKYSINEYRKILIIKHDVELDMDVVYDIIYNKNLSLTLKKKGFNHGKNNR